jgi:hypothetical protein
MLAAIIAFGLFGAPKPQPCPSQDFVQCQDTRALLANPGFHLALQTFLGDAHERLLRGDRPLYDQVLDMMSTPEDHALEVGQNMKMFVGCKRMACPEKAAFIVDQTGIKAIGVIDYSHGEPALEVIVRRREDTEMAPQQALHDWAEACVSHQASHDHANTSLHDIRVRALEDDGPGGAAQPATRQQAFFSLPHQ